jgi:hypothetical protein
LRFPREPYAWSALPAIAFPKVLIHTACNDGGGNERPSRTAHREDTIMRNGTFMWNGTFHLCAAVALALTASSAQAQKKYDSGATDTEIKIGQTVPFSGPASAYARRRRRQRP